MEKKKKKWMRVISIFLIILIAIPVTGFLILAFFVFPPEKLTPLIVNTSNQYLYADLQCEKVELTYAKTFPYLGIALTNGKIISRVAQDSLTTGPYPQADSLLSFCKCIVAVQPVEYLKSGKIVLKRVFIDRPRIYGYVNAGGKANWEIYQTDTLPSDTAQQKPLPPIDLQRVRIKDASLTYNDRQQDLFVHVDSFFMTLAGSLSYDTNQLDIQTGWADFQYLSPDYSLENKLSFRLNSKLETSQHLTKIKLTDTEMFINELPFSLSGHIAKDTCMHALDVDIDYRLKIPDLNALLGFIPSAFRQQDNAAKATGCIRLEGNIKGLLNDSVFPVVDLCCILDNGSLYGKSADNGIDSLALDVDLHLDMAHSDSSYIVLSQMLMKGKHATFDMKGTVSDLIKNPQLTACLKGDINFTELSKTFVSPDTLEMEGRIKLDIDTKFRIKDMQQGNYGKIFAQGQMDLDHFKATSKPFDIHMTITQAALNLDSETQSDKFLNGQKLLNGRLYIDSLNMKWKDEIVTVLSNLNIGLSTPPAMDTTSIIPVGAKISFNHLRTLMPDSAWLWAGKTELKGSIKPSPQNKRTPVASGIFTIDSVAFIYPQYKSAMLLTQSAFTVSAFPYKIDSTLLQRRRKQVLVQQDTLHRNRTIRRDSSIMLSRESSQLLRQWDVKGNVVFNDMKAFTPMFPLPLQMKGTNVLFTTNEIKLTNACLMAGKSDLTLSGNINSIRRALLRGGKLTANLSVVSDFVDCNELMNALSQGILYSEQKAMEETQNIQEPGFVDFQTATQSIVELPTDTSATGVFMLPDFLDLTLQTNAKEIKFNDLNLQNAAGEMILRDKSIQLNNLAMHSNIGCGKLSMLYKAKNKSEAAAGFDLNLDKIQVDKLIDLFPSIDTLVPMLRSFEGIVDCQIAATCKLDSTLSIQLPSLYSACYLHGQNMVLLDGETFAEISKTLMFKNKKRNLIDNIAVELVIRDSKIEVFPFLVEMDRYRVAVGGTHHMDMTFNYHISVLKSPVPFKLGIDITGNLDKFKYKITKCRYKDIFKPAKSGAIDTTTLNVRQQIYDAIHKRIELSM